MRSLWWLLRKCVGHIQNDGLHTPVPGQYPKSPENLQKGVYSYIDTICSSLGAQRLVIFCSRNFNSPLPCFVFLNFNFPRLLFLVSWHRVSRFGERSQEGQGYRENDWYPNGVRKKWTVAVVSSLKTQWFNICARSLESLLGDFKFSDRCDLYEIVKICSSLG